MTTTKVTSTSGNKDQSRQHKHLQRNHPELTRIDRERYSVLHCGHGYVTLSYTQLGMRTITMINGCEVEGQCIKVITSLLCCSHNNLQFCILITTFPYGNILMDVGHRLMVKMHCLCDIVMFPWRPNSSSNMILQTHFTLPLEVTRRALLI
jgi:hypothetical protein